MAKGDIIPAIIHTGLYNLLADIQSCLLYTSYLGTLIGNFRFKARFSTITYNLIIVIMTTGYDIEN